MRITVRPVPAWATLAALALVAAVLIALGPPSTETARTKDSAAKSAGRSLLNRVDACYARKSDFARCRNLNVSPGPGQAEVVSASGDTVAVVSHSKSGTNFRIEEIADGQHSNRYRCDRPGIGACSATGGW